MQTFLIWIAAGFAVSTVLNPFFEWTLHRYVMHRPLGRFVYPFERHALLHHRVFKADHTYHLVHDHHKHTIPMAWWSAPVLIALAQIPFLVGAWPSGRWGLVCGSTPATMAYYAAYEYMHWCMHLPRQRKVERTGFSSASTAITCCTTAT